MIYRARNKSLQSKQDPGRATQKCCKGPLIQRLFSGSVEQLRHLRKAWGWGFEDQACKMRGCIGWELLPFLVQSNQTAQYQRGRQYKPNGSVQFVASLGWRHWNRLRVEYCCSTRQYRLRSVPGERISSWKSWRETARKKNESPQRRRGKRGREMKVCKDRCSRTIWGNIQIWRQKNGEEGAKKRLRSKGGCLNLF